MQNEKCKVKNANPTPVQFAFFTLHFSLEAAVLPPGPIG
jgi:hypothetical protein